jgi:hypothetical protein
MTGRNSKACRSLLESRSHNDQPKMWERLSSRDEIRSEAGRSTVAARAGTVAGPTEDHRYIIVGAAFACIPLSFGGASRDKNSNQSSYR